jgi:flavin reductase (DIM6/NTAB) family NADH-FMN oxidoreductase RutF/pimeloyl-ACP methyl ester carboxylesterase
LNELLFDGFGGLQLAADGFGSPEDPAVLLLHGGGQTRRVWREAARALADAGRYAICLDLRGHGQSQWALDGRYDLDALVADLRLVLAQLPARPVVVGASTGGLVALAALGEDSALASGLVLVDAAPWLEPRGLDRISQLLSSHARGFGSLEEAAAAAGELHPGRAAPPDVSGLAANLRKGDDGRLRWHWDPRFLDGFRPDAARLAEAAAALRQPTLLIHGAESEVVSLEAVQRLVDLIEDVELSRIEGAGHLVAREQVESFNATLMSFLERRTPREPLRYESGSEPRLLRDALGCFGTGVTVVTTLAADGAPIGLAANSFTSVSLDPPLILFCVAKSSRSLETFVSQPHFAINVLHIGQQPTSARFGSRQGEERFEGTPWEGWETGAPILRGSLASFECLKEAVHDGGDHLIFVGRVKRARYEPRRDPLLYFRGRYRRLHFA